MPSYAHNKIIEEIEKLDGMPPGREDFATWIRAQAHLEFLRQNARSDEILIYGSGAHSFVHAAVVPNERLASSNTDALLRWEGSPYSSIASYVFGGDGKGVWVERHTNRPGSSELEGAIQLVFGRTFEGWSGSEQTYFEINQEYTHLTGIHWRREQRAYCRFDNKGDLQHVVSITGRSETANEVLCVSFAWAPLEEYLAATHSTLVRRFDFTLLRPNSSIKWPSGPGTLLHESDRLVYQQVVVPGTAAYTAGVQIIGPRRPCPSIFQDLRDGQRDKNYVEFCALDSRNKRVAKISTDPKATTNYFDAPNNSLPYEMSPAFFRSEVILKYKTDRDKYTVGERDITCRAAWHLRAFDVNEAGQIFAYICYLRNLPYTEQLHWLSFNEKAKADISERARSHDFKGEFTDFPDPLREVLSILKCWQDMGAPWWTLREERLLDRISTPLSLSQDEWAEAFLDLAKLVVEGFCVKAIRARLDELGIAYEEEHKSIVLLELLLNEGGHSGQKQRLAGLRTVQEIRTKAKGHASSRKVDTLVQEVLADHGSFTKHFKHVCAKLPLELQKIAGAFAWR